MQKITMDMCQQVLNGIVQQVKQDGGKPVAIAICDQDGSLIALLKMDDVPARCVHFARHKAYTAARMQTRTAAFLARLYQEQLDISYFCDTNLTPLPGGAPILALDGTVLGSVGISGRPSEEDQHLADMAAELLYR
ncbi:heme-binding protein [Sporomusa sp.]|uniref:GlcG/HbpS family heme-binding protein n=1 Tax=Sporomusa sp. TaxID=2078658 RepID=UPI002C525867|nr:heme-binding protein [Sporomusa sp.]HWR06520.1 heme-binding protein [Sporomusa sp.]